MANYMRGTKSSTNRNFDTRTSERNSLSENIFDVPNRRQQYKRQDSINIYNGGFDGELEMGRETTQRDSFHRQNSVTSDRPYSASNDEARKNSARNLHSRIFEDLDDAKQCSPVASPLKTLSNNTNDRLFGNTVGENSKSKGRSHAPKIDVKSSDRIFGGYAQKQNTRTRNISTHNRLFG